MFYPCAAPDDSRGSVYGRNNSCGCSLYALMTLTIFLFDVRGDDECCLHICCDNEISSFLWVKSYISLGFKLHLDVVVFSSWLFSLVSKTLPPMFCIQE